MDLFVVPQNWACLLVFQRNRGVYRRAWLGGFFARSCGISIRANDDAPVWDCLLICMSRLSIDREATRDRRFFYWAFLHLLYRLLLCVRSVIVVGAG